MKNCQILVSIGSPARLVPSCVCAMDTDSPGLCTVPEMRGWLGGCCPEACPWRTDVPIESLASAQAPVTQYKLTCGYLPHEEQCEYQGNCGGCEYAEPVADKKALPCGYFSAGQCGSFDGTCEGCQYAETAQMCSAGSECGRDGRIKREGLKW